MSEPKLYRHNKSGEVVAAHRRYYDKTISIKIFTKNNTYSMDVSDFDKCYSVIPEALKPHSTAWACQMLEQGYKVTDKTENHKYLVLNHDRIIVNQDGYSYNIHFMSNDWQLYEEPKPIVEKLPHEFMKDEKVLVRSLEGWSLAYFKELSNSGSKIYKVDTKSSFGVCSKSHCIPYEGNEHLEGTFIGEHEYGAVPKGYVPPHVPKLGDDDYWQIDDLVVNLGEGSHAKVKAVNATSIALQMWATGEVVYILPNGKRIKNGLRVWFHDGSTVEKEHIPKRSHYTTQK